MKCRCERLEKNLGKVPNVSGIIETQEPSTSEKVIYLFGFANVGEWKS
jgi:hypothetical protein